jgi:hypothetical protein
MTRDEMERRHAEIMGPAEQDYIWSLWVEFVAAWITEHGPHDDDGAMLRAWRGEMSSTRG